ncbi:hypothetical protein MGYG_07196 [Nannizzia gypsea CBS 118893]|uniref:Serine hydrolase domain-containing protein n=1 Tax=Arthroderma gypseum (strain ATCC MYA-4604 / CBS 118893) TaxID=535722 RepID=E4V2C4_ARTGP|nr:hypothetical protein MGYG_07196 [Nannizzia gypsea CBS 118893]EFR04189.1 hypothetical protein MGYG_07196 [Nannizzia gypsea CBS 118893]
MKVLCLHGQGSNNEIFKLQTASFRADLPDFSFEFVQGTVPHTEGNWSLFTTSFSELPLYNYYNPISASSITQVEDEMLELIEQQGPFDGVIGYSGGAALAGQLLIRDRRNNPSRLPYERIFRWAVFINAGTPLEVFKISEMDVCAGVIEESAPKEAHQILLRPSNIRVREEEAKRHPDYDPEQIKLQLGKLKTRQLADSRLFMTDGITGIARYDGIIQGALIDIATLHVRSPTATNRHWGLGLMEMCEPAMMMEFLHDHGHDFPRGYADMKKVARLIRELSEMAG